MWQIAQEGQLSQR